MIIKRIQHVLLSTLCLFTVCATVSAEEHVVITKIAKEGRGLLGIIGDFKTNNFGRPAAEHHLVDGISILRVEGVDKYERALRIELNGDSCLSDGSACFSLYFLKSVRGALDMSHFNKLVFDVAVDVAPSEVLNLRAGGYPTRFEIDIRNQLPDVGQGWKTITIDRATIEQNSFEGFTMSKVADLFSLGTPGKVTLRLANVRWET